MAAPKVRWAHATADTGEDNIDITVANMVDDCQGAVVFISGPFTDGLAGASDDAIRSIGFLRITGDTTAEQMCIGGFSDTQADPQVCGKRGNNAAIGLLLNESAGTVFLSDYAIFAKRVTGGFNIEWNGGGSAANAGAAYQIDALCFFGGSSDYQMDIAEEISSSDLNGEKQSTLTGAFTDTPTFVFAASQSASLDNTTQADYYLSFGFASVEGGSPNIDQGGYSRQMEDNQTARDGAGRVDDQYILPMCSADSIARGQIELTDAGAGTLTWTTRESANAQRFFFFAISLPMDTHVGAYVSPSSTGNDSYTMPTGESFTYPTQAWIGVGGRIPDGSENTNLTTADAQCEYVGGADKDGNERAHGTRARNTTNFAISTFGNSTSIIIRNHTGTVRREAEFVSMETNGFTVNNTTAQAGDTIRIPVALFEDVPETISPNGVGADAAVGRPALSLVIAPDGIGADATPGQPTLAMSQTILPDGVGADGTPGSPTVALTQTIAPDGIGADGTPGQPSLTLVIAPGSPAADATPGSPTVAMSQTIAPDGVGVDATPGQPTVASSFSIVLSDGIGADATVSAIAVALSQTIVPDGIGADATPGSPTIASDQPRIAPWPAGQIVQSGAVLGIVTQSGAVVAQVVQDGKVAGQIAQSGAVAGNVVQSGAVQGQVSTDA